jgi:hypothetical protein
MTDTKLSVKSTSNIRHIVHSRSYRKNAEVKKNSCQYTKGITILKKVHKLSKALSPIIENY